MTPSGVTEMLHLEGNAHKLGEFWLAEAPKQAILWLPNHGRFLLHLSPDSCRGFFLVKRLYWVSQAQPNLRIQRRHLLCRLGRVLQRSNLQSIRLSLTLTGAVLSFSQTSPFFGSFAPLRQRRQATLRRSQATLRGPFPSWRSWLVAYIAPHIP